MKQLLLFTLFITNNNPLPMTTSTITYHNPNQWIPLRAHFDGFDFYIEKDNKVYYVPKERLSSVLHNITTKKLDRLLKRGFISVNETPNGEYHLVYYWVY